MQALATRLGCVTGMDLAQMNRAFLPRWLNIGLWLMAEASIVCADISQVTVSLIRPPSWRFMEELVFCLLHLSKRSIGYWYSNSYQSLDPKDTCDGGLRHISLRHSFHPYILQTRWDLAQNPCFRGLRFDLCHWNLHHVLY
jgi:hypothetical protein